MPPPLALVNRIAAPGHAALADNAALLQPTAAPPGRAALFIDLAGVLLDTAPSPGQPAGLRAGVGPALRLLERLDYRIVVLAPCTLDRRKATQLPAARVADLLSRERVIMAGLCGCGSTAAPCGDCPPATALIARAAREHGAVLARSWLLGRSAQHLVAGQRAGCRTLLIGADGAGAAVPHAGTIGAEATGLGAVNPATSNLATSNRATSNRAMAGLATAGLAPGGGPPAWTARDIVDAALAIIRLDGAG
jgi:D-glycero-D-manno-heptose 1,7-bisphosphate phosphatase